MPHTVVTARCSRPALLTRHPCALHSLITIQGMASQLIVLILHIIITKKASVSPTLPL